MSEKLGFEIACAGLILTSYWMIKDSDLAIVGSIIFACGLGVILIFAKQQR